MSTAITVHHAVSIKVQAKQLACGSSPFVSTKFTFTDDKGHVVTVEAFSDDFIAIEGAEHVNHVASEEAGIRQEREA